MYYGRSVPLFFYFLMLFFFIPFLVLIRFAPRFLRSHIDNMESGWLTPCSWAIENVMGTKLIFTGEGVVPGEKALYITNHRTRLDWMFLWGYFNKEGRLTDLKIVMKKQLKYWPFFGPAMQTAQSIFLARDFEKDKMYIENVLKFFGENNYKPQILFFPEGTDKTANTTRISDNFAQKMNYLPLNNTIHPRIMGFTFFVECMKKYGLIDSVYDFTIGYTGTIPQTEASFFTGFPKECHVHVKRYDIKDLPNDEKALGEWLREKWYEKDKRLEAFYKNQKFERENGEPQHRSTIHDPQTIQTYTVIIFVVWLVWILVTLYFFINNSVVFWCTIASWVASHTINFFGGMDLWEMYPRENRSVKEQ